MLLRCNADGSDSELEGVVFAERQVMVRNARLLAGDQRRTVEKNGFELFFRPLAQGGSLACVHPGSVPTWYLFSFILDNQIPRGSCIIR
jgi:hypothetical protein